MGKDSGGPPRATPTGTMTATPRRSTLSADVVRAFTDRAPRCRVAMQVLYTVPGETPGSDLIEAELVNVSSSGMLLANAQPLPVGAVVEFQFKLDEGLVALAGRAEVMRAMDDPPRTGLRFVLLDVEALTLLQQLIAASEAAPEVPTTPGYVAPAVEFEHGTVRVRLTAATAGFFTYNPLLHVGVAGCFLPAETDVPLGTGYQLDILDESERPLLRCKAKVAAKQERWVGLRFLDFERSALQALRAEIARLSVGRGE
jgi:hypothetical protein